MKALLFQRSIPRYLLIKGLGRRVPTLCTSRWSPLKLTEFPSPELPGAEWVHVRPRLAGICGSDIATVAAKGSPYFAPVTSMPFVLGHEVVGTVVACGGRAGEFAQGDRVVLRPALGCSVRGIDPPCTSCATGHDALCRNVAYGAISAGIQTGYCRDTGGGFSGGFVAHRSQLRRVPGGIPDRAAVLVEPFACAIHGALRTTISASDSVLVIGCGSIGLLTIAALRASGCKARITAVARYGHQREHAARLGADVAIDGKGSIANRYAAWATALDAEVFPPEFGKPLVLGGASVVFDCVGTSETIDDGVRFTRGGGTLVLVGMPGIPRGVDWTSIWFKELSIRAAYAYGPESRLEGTRDSFDLALQWMAEWQDRLVPLVGEPLPLTDYREAFAQAMSTGRSGVTKTVFDLESSAK
ncbi:MAG: zinc-binding dehydrogenase [Phycisphaerae bacterium]|nr:zinc-binding dehydrogenase [Phycisphaerae bacterium]